MILRNIAQVFTWKSESVRVKRVCKFWPWRPCLRAILFQENGTSYRPVHTRMKRYCLVVLKYHKKKFGKSRICAGEIPKHNGHRGNFAAFCANKGSFLDRKFRLAWRIAHSKALEKLIFEIFIADFRGLPKKSEKNEKGFLSTVFFVNPDFTRFR